VRRAAIAVFLSATLLYVGPRPTLAEPDSVEGAAILDRTFSQIYEIDQVRVAEVTVTNHGGEKLKYIVELASKRINGRLHSYGLFTHPPRLRNMAMLTIEASNRSDDHFIYMPASGRVRRISSAKRADSFMGTDLTYEDFERRRTEDYHVDWIKAITDANEPIYRIGATPRYNSGVSRVEFDISSRDNVLLETRSFKEDAESPFRVLRAPRADIAQIGGKPMPTRLVVENFSRRTVTVVEFDQLQIVDDLADSLFSATNLQVRRNVPGLVGVVR